MSITVLKKLRIRVLTALTGSPKFILTADDEGNVTKADYEKMRYRNIDGGSANTVYLAAQNIDGGASIPGANGIINGGNA